MKVWRVESMPIGRGGWKPPLRKADIPVFRNNAMQLSRPLPLSDDYRQVMRSALTQHAVIAILCVLVLDGGHLARLCGLCMAGFWIGVFIMMARRPLTPTRGDLLFIRYGFLLLFGVAMRWMTP